MFSMEKFPVMGHFKIASCPTRRDTLAIGPIGPIEPIDSFSNFDPRKRQKVFNLIEIFSLHGVINC